MSKTTKTVNASGKRKSAIAKATVREGSGLIRINNVFIDSYTPKLSRMKIMEPLFIVDEIANSVDIDINVIGGGFNSQAEAARLAVAKGIFAFTKNKKIKDAFLSYDRQLMVADVRRKEPKKPNSHSKARAKRQKSYR